MLLKPVLKETRSSSRYARIVDDWIERYASALSANLNEELEMPSSEERSILALAREVAHGTERKNAPLTTFLVGRYCSLREQQGASPEDSMREANEIADRLLGEFGQQS